VETLKQLPYWLFVILKAQESQRIIEKLMKFLSNQKAILAIT
jgi:hypothetical protein